MTIIQELIEDIESFSFQANGQTWDYEALGYQIREMAYDYKDDEVSFVLESEAHGDHLLFNILDVLDEDEPFFLLVYDMKTHSTDANFKAEHETSNGILYNIREFTIGHTPEAHTI